ncbi:hypothetical protein LP415_25615 [Polaromonas sp. P1(28)-8]|nr:hypothetical protein LP415_25615 [Polaromonas sp. P1(28)-8]
MANTNAFILLAPLAEKLSIPFRDRQFLGREQCDHAAAIVGHHALLLNEREGI